MPENLLKFPAQLHAFRKTTLGDNLITFSIDRAYSDQVVDIVRKEIGTEFVVYLEDVTKETNLNEDRVEVRERFVRKMHALLGELSELLGTTKEEEKEHLKEVLKKKGVIKESTKELDLKGLAQACNYLEDKIAKHGNT